MFGEVVLGVEYELFETILQNQKAISGVQEDTELSTEDLQNIIHAFENTIAEATGRQSPKIHLNNFS